MKEEWRTIKGYEGMYEVSNEGRVRSLDRYAGKNYIKGKVLSMFKGTGGYTIVSLCINGKNKSFSVHRLVAEAFIPNPHDYPQVNHKDENKNNNDMNNLEWCTAKYNSNYGTHNQRLKESSKHRLKPVYQIDKDCGTIIMRWESIKEAAEAIKLSPTLIWLVCNKRGNKTAGGFCWEYANGHDECEGEQ